MLSTTLQAVRSILAADPSVNPPERNRLLAILRAGGAEPKLPVPPVETRIVRRAETARRLSRSLRSVDLLAKTGVLHKLKFPGRTRAAGFLSSEIDRLLAEVVSHV